MAMQVLKLTSGDPYGKDKFYQYALEPMEASPELAEAIEKELSLWEFHFERVEVYDHDEYGKERSVSEGKPVSVLLDKAMPVVWNGRLVAVKRKDALFFIPSGKGIGTLSETLWSESSSRWDRYEVENISIVKNAASEDPVRYEEEGDNPYHTVAGVDPKAKQVSIASGAVVVSSDAFENCNELLSLFIPASVKEIGEVPFSDCKALESITVDEKNPVFKGVGGCLINIQEGFLIVGTADAQIPANEGIEVIGQAAFSERKMGHIAIPEGVKRIDWAAFTHSKIDSVVLPKTLQKVDSFAFEYGELGAIYFTGTKEDWKSIHIGIRNKLLYSAPKYYYSEEKPTEEGNFWHYGENGEIMIWTL
ncbi:MAG: leucine-rich repeat domain-containing protein [Clostridia bacterium]|nr:leucine-rich repeat domain-containing protein [Clostridia bacterium]